MSAVEVQDDVRVALRVVLDSLHRLRGESAVGLVLDDLRRYLGTPDEPWPLGALDEALQGEDGCPECPTGTVEPVGRQERETGHQPYACDARCGYSG